MRKERAVLSNGSTSSIISCVGCSRRYLGVLQRISSMLAACTCDTYMRRYVPRMDNSYLAGWVSPADESPCVNDGAFGENACGAIGENASMTCTRAVRSEKHPVEGDIRREHHVFNF